MATHDEPPEPGVLIVHCTICGGQVGSKDDAPRHGLRDRPGIHCECADTEEHSLRAGIRPQKGLIDAG